MAAPTLATERVVLRPWLEADREPYVAMHADPRVMRTLGGIKTRERALADAAYLAERLQHDGFGWWVLAIPGVTPFAGCIALQDIPFQAHFTPAFEVGWRLAAEYWGNGYATEGARAALRFAFDALGKGEVVAITARINAASQRVMRRLAMVYDEAGDFDHPRLAEGDPLRPHVLYRIARS